MSGWGNGMLDQNEIVRLYRSGQLDALHRSLDAASPGETPNDRHFIASWRAAAFQREKRYEEALDHLQRNRDEFGSKTDLHQTRATILDVLGRDAEALRELQTAPFEAEIDKYRSLVVDAKFYLLHFMVKRGIPIDRAALDEIPEGYRSVLPGNGHTHGLHVSKDDIKAMLDRAS